MVVAKTANKTKPKEIVQLHNYLHIVNIVLRMF